MKLKRTPQTVSFCSVEHLELCVSIVRTLTAGACAVPHGGGSRERGGLAHGKPGTAFGVMSTAPARDKQQHRLTASRFLEDASKTLNLSVVHAETQPRSFHEKSHRSGAFKLSARRSPQSKPET